MRETLQKTKGLCFLVPTCWLCRLLQHALCQHPALPGHTGLLQCPATSAFTASSACTLASIFSGRLLPSVPWQAALLQSASRETPLHELSGTLSVHCTEVPKGKHPENSASAAAEWLLNYAERQSQGFSNEVWISAMEVDLSLGAQPNPGVVAALYICYTYILESSLYYLPANPLIC